MSESLNHDAAAPAESSSDRFERLLAAARSQRGSVPERLHDRSGERAPLTRDELATRLTGRVLDQPQAVEMTTRALLAPINGLQLRPERPNGALFFYGPTGVGKTQMAYAIAETVYGSADALIRVDCSECSGAQSTTGLIGPPPGYVGHDNDTGWLTTRVLRMQQGVVLFDEVEKADPAVWNLLLQVLDAGRLTDTRGRTARFADTTVVLTSNLGAAAYSDRGVGFATTSSRPAANAGASAVERALPPELLARFDAVVPFAPLATSSMTRIALQIIDRFNDAQSQRGWHITVGPEVINQLVASAGDGRLGVRRLEQAIEREILGGLVGLPPAAYTCESTGDGLNWSLT